MKIAKHPVFIDHCAILAEKPPFKLNNFPVFSLLKTELEVSDYPVTGESEIHTG